MPYTSKKTGKNKITVMKKDTDEIVGHTTPEKYDDYMAALHIHEGDSAAEGGITDDLDKNDDTPFQIPKIPAQTEPGEDLPAMTPPPTMPNAPKALPGMPPDVSGDDIAGYLGQKKQEISKYGPEQQMAVQNALLKARTGLGGGLAQAGGGLADAIMQGVARAGNPGFQEKIQNQGKEVTGELTEAMQKAHEQEGTQAEAEMKLDATDPNSAPSKAAQGSIGQVLVSKLGYKPEQVAKMSAQQIETTANLAMKYEDIETQAGLRQAMLQFQAAMGGATVANQRAQRQAEAAKALEGRGMIRSLMDLIPGTGGHAAAKALQAEVENNGTQAVGPYGNETVRNGKTYVWHSDTGKYYLKS